MITKDENVRILGVSQFIFKCFRVEDDVIIIDGAIQDIL